MFAAIAAIFFTVCSSEDKDVITKSDKLEQDLTNLYYHVQEFSHNIADDKNLPSFGSYEEMVQENILVLSSYIQDISIRNNMLTIVQDNGYYRNIPQLTRNLDDLDIYETINILENNSSKEFMDIAQAWVNGVYESTDLEDILNNTDLLPNEKLALVMASAYKNSFIESRGLSEFLRCKDKIAAKLLCCVAISIFLPAVGVPAAVAVILEDNCMELL